jgi:TRAP-type C4-dicarboxylate transport system permease large subunit
VSLIVTWWFVVRKDRPSPKGQPRRCASVLKACAMATWALVLPFIIVFGLKFGVFTPTEAAVVAAVYALFVSTVIYRETEPEASGAAVRGRPRPAPS